MKPTHDDGDLRRLLAGCVFPDRFDARALPQAFRAVVAALTESGVSYAVVGQLALARYCRAQCTDRIAVQIGAEADPIPHAERLRTAMAEMLPKDSTIVLEVSAVATAIEQSFIARAVSITWLDTMARLATAEHLLWLALSDSTPEAEVEAVHLIQSGHLDLDGFESWCLSVSPDIGHRFAKARRRAAQTMASTYSASIERRLTKRRQSPHNRDR